MRATALGFERAVSAERTFLKPAAARCGGEDRRRHSRRQAGGVLAPNGAGGCRTRSCRRSPRKIGIGWTAVGLNSSARRLRGWQGSSENAAGSSSTALLKGSCVPAGRGGVLCPLPVTREALVTGKCRPPCRATARSTRIANLLRALTHFACHDGRRRGKLQSPCRAKAGLALVRGVLVDVEPA